MTHHPCYKNVIRKYNLISKQRIINFVYLNYLVRVKKFLIKKQMK